VTAQPFEGIVKDASANNLVAPSGMDLRKATTIARDKTGGRVLSAKRRKGAQSEFEVRLLVDEERVVHVIVDANGRVRSKR
jgi:hypothetical protein